MGKTVLGSDIGPKAFQGGGADALDPQEVLHPGVGPSLHDPLGQHGANPREGHELLEAGLVQADGLRGWGVKAGLRQGFHPHRLGFRHQLGPEAGKTQEGYREEIEEVEEDHSVKARPSPPRRTPASTHGSAPGFRTTKATV